MPSDACNTVKRPQPTQANAQEVLDPINQLQAVNRQQSNSCQAPRNATAQQRAACSCLLGASASSAESLSVLVQHNPAENTPLRPTQHADSNGSQPPRHAGVLHVALQAADVACRALDGCWAHFVGGIAPCPRSQQHRHHLQLALCSRPVQRRTQELQYQTRCHLIVSWIHGQHAAATHGTRIPQHLPTHSGAGPRAAAHACHVLVASSWNVLPQSTAHPPSSLPPPTGAPFMLQPLQPKQAPYQSRHPRNCTTRRLQKVAVTQCCHTQWPPAICSAEVTETRPYRGTCTCVLVGNGKRSVHSACAVPKPLHGAPWGERRGWRWSCRWTDTLRAGARATWATPCVLVLQ
jgi:hypothetical protein